jgi:hypothetical protein
VLFTLTGAVRRDPAVNRWMLDHSDEVGALAYQWFEVIRGCGDDVTELLHDGAPTACVNGAAFAYVNVFRTHANVGFFNGAALPDPAGLLEGTGRSMRHVKLRPDSAVDDAAMRALIRSAYADIRRELTAKPTMVP